MITEKKEKRILMMSFISGLAFAVIEFIFSIYSHSQSALTDAVYDASELVFIALLLFLTPLFHKPVSEKHPLAGGNAVNNAQISVFQLFLGIASIIIFVIMKKWNRNLSSPTIEAELLGWKLDIVYSLGMSFAFFISLYLERTPIAFVAPYFDQIVAVVVMIFMLPESVKVLWNAIKEVFLFSPEKHVVDEIKTLCNPILEKYQFFPVFYDVTKTGRHLWIAVYFQIATESMSVRDLESALRQVNEQVKEKYQECTCELILVPGK